MADLATVLSCLVMAVALEFMSRAVGVLVSIGLATLGLALFAATYNIPTLSAAQVFYGIGFTGVRLLVDVLVTDTALIENRALILAVLAIPWPVAIYCAPLINRAPRSPEMRLALIVLAGFIPFVGVLLFSFLQYNRDRTVPHKSFASLMRRLQGKPTRGSFHASSRPNRFAGWWRLGLPLTTFILLWSLVGLFLVLWLVQMGVLPWFSAIPPIVFFFVCVVLLIMSNYDTFNDWLCRRVENVGLSFAKLWDGGVKQRIQAKTSNIRARIAAKRYESTISVRAEGVLAPVSRNEQLAVCFLCLLFKCESSEAERS